MIESYPEAIGRDEGIIQVIFIINGNRIRRVVSERGVGSIGQSVGCQGCDMGLYL